MTDTGLGDSPTAVQCPLCPYWARSDSWHIRHAERIRELEAELAILRSQVAEAKAWFAYSPERVPEWVKAKLAREREAE